MKIEVFKEYDGKLRLFDAINPDYVTWMFDSENHRDGASAPPYRNESELGPTEQLPPTEYFPNEGTSNPPAFHNPSAPYPEDLEGTIYFDSVVGEYRLYSTQKNIVLDYSKPRILSYSGNFVAFNSDPSSRSERTRWKLELIIQDDSGIDAEVYSLYNILSGMMTVPLVEKTRKNEDSSDPYWNSKTVTSTSGVTVEFQQSSIDSSTYRVTIEIDPNDEEVYRNLNDCTFLQYLRLDFEFFDLAGNSLVGPFPNVFVKYDMTEEELLDQIKRLELGFVDTYPPSMLVTEDVIGKTTIAVTNPDYLLSELGFHVKIGLREGSVGYLSGRTEEEILRVDDKVNVSTATQKVDGIDRSGYVKAYAYLDGSVENLNCSPSGETISFDLDTDLAARIRALTYVEGDLGPFISECEDNERKLYVDPFVPSVLKNEKIFGLCKLFETYLNTMYPNKNGSCRIGVLEKIHRISEFKNPDACTPDMLPNFASEHGSELLFNYDDVKSAAAILAKYEDQDLRESEDSLTDSIYRRFYSILPYVDRWKGTERSIELLYRVLGIRAEMKPMWEGPTGRLVEEGRADDDYRLTSHISISLTSEKISSRDMKKLSSFAMKAVKSILPVNRVIGDVKIYDKLVSTMNELVLFSTMTAIEKRPAEDKPEKIFFAWKCSEMNPIRSTSSSREISIEVPMYASRVEVGHERSSTDGYPIPESASHYFTRFRRTIDRYSKPISICFSIGKQQNGSIFSTGTDLQFSVSRVDLRRNKIILTCDKTDGSSAAMSSFNVNCKSQDNWMVVAFKFSRAVEDYCVPITLSEYHELSSLQRPYEVKSNA